MFNQYVINEQDRFIPEHYPKVVSELTILSQGIANVPGESKGDMIISFVKDHSMKNEWLKASPRLCNMITSRVFPTGEIESLFASSSHNKTFSRGLEDYILHHMFLMKFKDTETPYSDKNKN